MQPRAAEAPQTNMLLCPSSISPAQRSPPPPPPPKSYISVTLSLFHQPRTAEAPRKAHMLVLCPPSISPAAGEARILSKKHMLLCPSYISPAQREAPSRYARSSLQHLPGSCGCWGHCSPPPSSEGRAFPRTFSAPSLSCCWGGQFPLRGISDFPHPRCRGGHLPPWGKALPPVYRYTTGVGGQGWAGYRNTGRQVTTAGRSRPGPIPSNQRYCKNTDACGSLVGVPTVTLMLCWVVITCTAMLRYLFIYLLYVHPAMCKRLGQYNA